MLPFCLNCLDHHYQGNATNVDDFAWQWRQRSVSGSGNMSSVCVKCRAKMPGVTVNLPPPTKKCWTWTSNDAPESPWSKIDLVLAADLRDDVRRTNTAHRSSDDPQDRSGLLEGARPACVRMIASAVVSPPQRSDLVRGVDRTDRRERRAVVVLSSAYSLFFWSSERSDNLKNMNRVVSLDMVAADEFRTEPFQNILLFPDLFSAFLKRYASSERTSGKPPGEGREALKKRSLALISSRQAVRQWRATMCPRPNEHGRLAEASMQLRTGSRDLTWPGRGWELWPNEICGLLPRGSQHSTVGRWRAMRVGQSRSEVPCHLHALPLSLSLSARTTQRLAPTCNSYKTVLQLRATVQTFACVITQLQSYKNSDHKSKVKIFAQSWAEKSFSCFEIRPLECFFSNRLTRISVAAAKQGSDHTRRLADRTWFVCFFRQVSSTISFSLKKTPLDASVVLVSLYMY